MTWIESRERTRVIREVEAAAAADMSGALPWRAEWVTLFDSPADLVAALRARRRWMREGRGDGARGGARGGARPGEAEADATRLRLRRSDVGVLAILERWSEGPVGADGTFEPLRGRVAPPRLRRRRRHPFGTVLVRG